MRTIQSAHIRLKNNRRAVLDTCEVFPGEFETMLLYPGSGDEITSAKAATKAEALADFDRIRRQYEAPGPSGRYAALAEALKAARDTGEQAAEALGDDWGTCNMDAPAVCLPRWNRKQVEAAAEAAGVGCFKWHSMGGGCYVFPLRFGYQGNANTAAAEAARDSLKAAGYDALVYYQID